MANARSEKLEQFLLDLLPLDGTNVGNGQLLARFQLAASAAGLPEITDAEFNTAREGLLARGLIVKGKGRGGSTARAALAAPEAENFELEAGPVVEPAQANVRSSVKPAKQRRNVAARAGEGESAQVISYRHTDKRKNNPEVGLVSEASDPQQPKKVWAYNPHLDPVLNFDSSRAELEDQVANALASGDPAVMKAALEEIQRRGAPYLQWAGKAERTSFEVDTVSLHVHERIDPMSILSAVRKGGGADNNGKPADEAKLRQASLFEAPFENLPLRDAVDFYRHDKGWANRLVSGDSLQVMNSLLVKEGMAGQVQMVYFDPPYGIRYGSNFQPFVGKRDVKDKSDADLTQEPEMIKAFRDTWELGVHSYLTYLRDRLLLAQSLLDDSGSVFVQISEENVHFVRQILSEVFGAENFVADIIFVKAGALGSSGLPRRNDYIIWYAKSASAVKYKQLFVEKSPEEDLGAYRLVQEASGKIRPARTGDDLTKVRALRSVLMTKPGPGQKYEFEHLGRPISCGARWWGFPPDNMTRLQKAGRVAASGSDSIRYLDDFAASYISNVWLDTATGSGMGKLDAAKKDGDKLKLLAGHINLKPEARKRFDEQQPDDQLVTLIQAAPIDAAVKDYLLGATEYVNRLREIVKAAKLPKDREERLLALDKEDLLRAIVDSVGKQGQAGQGLQSVISVAMLSEGWDAKNVTHIMGLRAFTSQLLCEQVIGRGLRRVGYDRDENGLFVPEYVNVFGVPLSVFVDADDGGPPPPPPKPSTQIESLSSRNELEVRWPNLLRVDVVVKPTLAVAWSTVPALRLDPAATPISAELAPAVGGATDLGKTTGIDLEKLPEDFREQRIIFQAARKAFDQMSGRFKGNREYLVFQLIRLVEQFISPAAKKLDIPSLFHSDGLRRRILIALNADLVVQHLVKHVEQQNVASIEPVFDPEQPIGSTRTMRTWYTTKGNQPTKRSQISHVVGDSSWEIYAANIFDSSDLVSAYAKNDHLGFQIFYLWGGSRRRFLPDFIVRLANGKTLVLEIKGEDSPQNVAKRDALKLWVDAVNAKGGFGQWCWDVAFEPAHVHDIVQRHGQGKISLPLHPV